LESGLELSEQGAGRGQRILDRVHSSRDVEKQPVQAGRVCEHGQ
jgi:hypothetical protein